MLQGLNRHAREPMWREDGAPTRVFESVSADYFSAGGHTYLVYVDRLSGWPCYNKSTRRLPALKLGSRVDIQDPTTGRWNRIGVIVGVGQRRTYLVKTASGRTRRAAAPAAVAAPMRLGHLNIRSVTAHLDQLAQLLMTYRLDIICLTETFINSDVDDRTLIVPGYQILRRDRPGGGSAGGVAILLRSELRTKELQTPAAGSALETLWLQELSLHQLVTSPTRQSENPTLIDHIVTNRPQTATETRVTPCDISDHDLISTTVAGVREPRQRVTVTVRPTRRVNTDAMCLDLLLADWSGVTDCDNISDMWTAFLATWHPIIDHHMPMRTLQLRHQAYPWLRDEEVQAAMAARRRARRARDRAPSESTQQQRRTCRNAVKTTLNRACAAFFEHSYKYSRPKTWKNVRQFLVASGKARPRTTSPAATDQQWANKLNDHFASIGPSVAAALAESDTGVP
ncbi:hypothetical protein FJT64_004248 [Amphibalanus amphitrite]|uniref:Endonuclease/exonuclease/phosphatase domain-containing protein n=1 Tax=Amphibalanus amphitrite TaxID=1232801 RepID=A0A6A4W5V3_AMPAM|nr:hypothetical protein FJT64_004248 [Amphibalanus amphitrite]